jgi:transcription termination factor Rho
MHLSELKQKSPADLLDLAEELELEDPGNMRRQELMFAILKQSAENDEALFGDGTLKCCKMALAICARRKKTIFLARMTYTSAPT